MLQLMDQITHVSKHYKAAWCAANTLHVKQFVLQYLIDVSFSLALPSSLRSVDSISTQQEEENKFCIFLFLFLIYFIKLFQHCEIPLSFPSSRNDWLFFLRLDACTHLVNSVKNSTQQKWQQQHQQRLARDHITYILISVHVHTTHTNYLIRECDLDYFQILRYFLDLILKYYTHVHYTRTCSKERSVSGWCHNQVLSNLPFLQTPSPLLTENVINYCRQTILARSHKRTIPSWLHPLYALYIR